MQALIAEECGEPISAPGSGELSRIFPSAAVLAESALGFLPRSTADALRAAAQTVAGLRSNAPPDDLLAKLRATKGVGEAAIEYVAMRALNDSDALPADLMELRVACDRAEGWKPWRAYGAMLLLQRGHAPASGARES
jgi:AraC family transcriptional regulator of adaptative response / DNA-3-methyladenine glycosylase II